ncbi:MAG: hypothetical protein ACLU37_07985 [Collinsella sp.]
MPPADLRFAHRAPVICAISGSGGCGKSTIVATMAHTSSLLGLRAAVLDLDLMFGNLYDLLVDARAIWRRLSSRRRRAHSRAGYRSRIDARGAGRYALGVPSRRPTSRAHGTSGGATARCLARESDVVFIDTSVFGATPWRLRWRRATVAWSLAMRRCRRDIGVARH